MRLRLVRSRTGAGRSVIRRGVRSTAALGTLAALLTLTPALAGAQDATNKRDELQAQIGEASAQEAAQLAQLQAIRNKKAGIDARVRDLDAQVTAAQAKLVPLEAEAARLAKALQEVQERLARTQAKLDRAQVRLDHSAAEMYLSARSGNAYELALAAPPEDVVRSDRYLDHISKRRDRIVRQVTKLRNQVEEQRQQTDQEKANADAIEAKAQAERDNVARLRSEIEPARAEAAAQEAAEQKTLSSIQAKKAQYQTEFNQLQAASDYVASLLRSSSTGGGAAGSCTNRPVPGGISSGFGPRYHPVLHYTRMHTGADMRASYGEPIHACRSGRVVLAGWNGGYGNCVVIDHGGGMATLYGHQSRIAVSVGQQVSGGEVIGYVGSTGMSTGPHLHFEVRLAGNPVDPAPYL